MATIDRYYFVVCTRGAERRGADVNALLWGSGIDPAWLAVPGWRGPVTAMATLVQRIWNVLGDERMGFTQHPAPRGAFAFAAGLALEGETVLEGLQRAAKFYNLIAPGITTNICEQDGDICLTARFSNPELDPDHYFSEFWLIIWHRLACWLSGATVPLNAAEFNYCRPVAYFQEFKYLFPCKHKFGAASASIRMNAIALQGPVRRTIPELEEMVAQAPLELMTIPASDLTRGHAVRLLLGRELNLDSASISAALSISNDVLRRALSREGTSVSRIRGILRAEVASRMLVQSKKSVEVIAAELGYAEARSFTRAFKMWTGESPSEFRRRHRSARYFAD